MHPRVRRAIKAELPSRDEDPFDIRWGRVPGDDFLRVDRDARTLWLNKRYRSAVLGDRGGSLNDAPILKALLFLLTEDVFAGQNFGPRDKDNVELWQAVLSAAAAAERDR